MTDLGVPEFLQSWFESNRAAPMLLVGAVVVLAGACALLWQIFGRGPQRGRRLHRAQRLLEQGDWAQALAIIENLQTHGRLSAAWKKRLATAESECQKAAADEALAAKNFEAALGYSVQAARITGGNELQARGTVIAAMLEEVRRLFATASDNKPTYQLIERILKLQSPCLEAFFWRAMCQLRDADPERAIASLEGARSGDTSGDETSQPAAPDQPNKATLHIDPPLYLGALLLRQGQAKDALRYLTEANRLDGNCPFVVCQLGAAMIRAGGDAQLAVRALQRALGPRGFELWAKIPSAPGSRASRKTARSSGNLRPSTRMSVPCGAATCKRSCGRRIPRWGRGSTASGGIAKPATFSAS
jgi:tetratricopeptide (TPR) repeat protein